MDSIRKNDDSPVHHSFALPWIASSLEHLTYKAHAIRLVDISKGERLCARAEYKKLFDISAKGLETVLNFQ
jgi:hypothetical protein